jgi:hypothetical protein
MRRFRDDCLDGLAAVARIEAATAAAKVRLAAGFTESTRAMAAPDASPQERKVLEMAMVAEVACVLTVSERSAGALLDQSRELTTALPLTLAALQAGSMSWQHARVMVDETTNLDPAGAAALEAHFLDRDAVNPATGCPAGEMVPGRFRAKPARGGNATTRSASKNVMPGVSWTGGWNTHLTGTAWPGSRPTFRRTRQPGSGTAPPPPPAPSKTPARAGH